MDEKTLTKKTIAELKTLAKEQNISLGIAKTKSQIIKAIIASDAPQHIEKTTAQPISKPKARVAKKVAKKDTEAKTIPVNSTNVEFNKNIEAPKSNYIAPQPQLVVESKPLQKTGTKLNPQNQVIPNVSNTNSINSVQNQNQRNPQINSNNSNNHNRNHNNQRNHQNNGQNRPQSQQNHINLNQSFNEPTIEVTGILDIMSDGTHGVLRTPKLIPTDKDTYIPISQVKKLKLRKGDSINGVARLPKENERYFSLLWIKSINGIEAEKFQSNDRIVFEDLKPIYPNKLIKLECGQYPISNRIIDMLAPIGFGQRAMIVAPPKTGKTFLLKDIAKGINDNYPEVQLIVVLIGERPEEVTDIERSVKGIVYASNFDDSPQNQVTVAELSLERAKRMVEMGQDVIILMDSLTRLARAYNVALPASGRTLSGGLDPVSLYPSKRFFGAARNFENGASLTIVATSLVETGSKMDDVIFEEFKGTGNMELKLDRKLSNKRIFPAIDLLESGTRNEELLLGTDALQDSWKIRKLLESLNGDGNEALIDRMKSTKTNEDFLRTLHQ